MNLVLDSLHIEGLDDKQNALVEARIGRILKSWEGTRHVAGCQLKKGGVDCVRFVSGVLDELYGIKTELARLPQDAAYHAKDTCFAALRAFMELYKYTEVENGILQPGDIVVAGPIGGGPGHALVAGLDCLWHCTSMGVARTGLDLSQSSGQFLKKILRGSNRERWA